MRLSGGRSFDGAVLATNPLTQASIEGLRHLETFDAAVESLSELVWCTAWDGMPEVRVPPAHGPACA